MHSCFPIVLSLCHSEALLGLRMAVEAAVQFQSVYWCAVATWCWILLSEVTTCWCSGVAGVGLRSWSMPAGHARPLKATRQTDLLDAGSSIKRTLRLYQPSMQRCHSQVSKLLAAGSRVTGEHGVHQKWFPTWGSGHTQGFKVCWDVISFQVESSRTFGGQFNHTDTEAKHYWLYLSTRSLD